MNDDDSRILLEVIHGNVAELPVVESWTHEQLRKHASRLDLVLERDVVAGVLERFGAGRLSPVVVQAWASFMRRGYLPGGGSEAIDPIEITYEGQHESAIADAVARLDELGDAVDGELRDGEAADLLGALAGDGSS
jgi:hypothetical protein